MDKPEQQAEQVTSADGPQVAELLLFDARTEVSSALAKPINIEKESQAVADLFDLNVHYGNYEKNITSGTERLSSDLRQLAGNMPRYNQLLWEVGEKIPDEPAVNPRLEFGIWKAKTGTWDRVAVGSGDGFPAYRIIQPGNTLSQIALETFNDITEQAKALGIESKAREELGANYKEYMDKIAKMNKIEDSGKIHVGQAFRLRQDFIWRF